MHPSASGRSLSFAVALLAVAIALALPARAAAQMRAPSLRHRPVLVWIGGGTQAAPPAFDTHATLPLNQEQATIDTRFDPKGGALFDAGGAIEVWRRLSVGAAISRYAHAAGADVTAALPHPLQFNQPRTISGSADDLQRRETALHIEALWAVPVSRAMTLRLFGGPSVFTLRQEFVTNVTYSESYPFDTAAYTGIEKELLSGTAAGVNVGADVSYQLRRPFGVGLLVRYTRASADLGTSSGLTASVKAGGLQVAAGARLLF